MFCKFRLYTIFAIVLVALCGCSSIMRPPSAAAFMSNYGSNKSAGDIGLAFYGGDLIDDDEYFPGDRRYPGETNINQTEWAFDYLFDARWNKGFLSYGFGLETFTPFAHLGFVSPYIGLSTWSSIYSPFNIAAIDNDNYWKGISLGGMLIEQIHINDHIKVGLFEHFSRNGSERKYTEVLGGLFAESPIPESDPIFYREVGGGTYVSYRHNEVVYAIEFRYGRDIDYHRNRFALILNLTMIERNPKIEK